MTLTVALAVINLNGGILSFSSWPVLRWCEFCQKNYVSHSSQKIAHDYFRQRIFCCFSTSTQHCFTHCCDCVPLHANSWLCQPLQTQMNSLNQTHHSLSLLFFSLFFFFFFIGLFLCSPIYVELEGKIKLKELEKSSLHPHSYSLNFFCWHKHAVLVQ